MTEWRRRRSRSLARGALLTTGLLALLGIGPAVDAATSPSSDDQALLAATDLFAAAPTEFRVEIDVRQVGAPSGMPLEVWRRGDALALVCLLAEKDRGKFLLRRDRDLFFIAPGSSRPVKLAPSYRLQGAAIDELLGLRLARDFRIASRSEAGGVVTFELVAEAPGAAASRLRWAVSRERRLPLRADFLSADGKVLRVIEFAEWSDPRRGIPARLVVKEIVRGGAPIEIRFARFDERPVPAALFDLEDGSARAALATGDSGAPPPPLKGP